MRSFPSFFTFFACFVKRWQWCDKTNTYWGLYTGCYWNFIHVHRFIGLLFTIILDLKHSIKQCCTPQTYYLALSLNFIVLTLFPLKTNIPQMKKLWKGRKLNYIMSLRNKRAKFSWTVRNHIAWNYEECSKLRSLVASKVIGLVFITRILMYSNSAIRKIWNTI